MKNFTKNFIFPSFLLLIVINLNAQDYYWSGGKKIELIKSDTKILVNTEAGSADENELKFSKEVNSVSRVNVRSLLVDFKPNEQNLLREYSNIRGNSMVSFKDSKGVDIIPTGEILFMPKDNVSYDEINKLSGNLLEIVEEKYGTYRTYIKTYSELIKVSNKIFLQYCKIGCKVVNIL